MDVQVGEREVEPLEQAEVAQIKIFAVDEFLRNDVAFAVGIDRDLVMVTALVKAGASFSRIETDKFVDLHDQPRLIELDEDLAGHEPDAFGRLHAACGVEAAAQQTACQEIDASDCDEGIFGLTQSLGCL